MKKFTTVQVPTPPLRGEEYGENVGAKITRACIYLCKLSALIGTYKTYEDNEEESVRTMQQAIFRDMANMSEEIRDGLQDDLEALAHNAEHLSTMLTVMGVANELKNMLPEEKRKKIEKDFGLDTEAS